MLMDHEVSIGIIQFCLLIHSLLGHVVYIEREGGGKEGSSTVLVLWYYYLFYYFRRYLDRHRIDSITYVT